jgi:hypothetical protein
MPQVSRRGAQALAGVEGQGIYGRFGADENELATDAWLDRTWTTLRRARGLGLPLVFMPRATRALLAVAAAVATTAGCGWTEGPHPDLITLEEARALPGPAPYWVGEAFEGLPLTAIAGPPPSVFIPYGECKYEASEEEGYGCTSPLGIETRPIEDPALYSPGRPCRRVTVRGIAGAVYGVGLDAYLELYSGDQTIVISADSPGRALRAAEALRSLDADRATTEDQPPPTIDVEPGLAAAPSRPATVSSCLRP